MVTSANRPMPLEGNIPLHAADAPATQTAAVVTLTCTTSEIIVIDYLIATYDNTNNGSITSTGLADAQLKVFYQTNDSNAHHKPLYLTFPGGLYGNDDGTDVVITLSSPGFLESATLSVFYHRAFI